ncbi:squalene/phytoene synthase family protein [Spirillospora sp. NPDC048911]|uniref:squalene/phytoene synthase family protein n=1 Tax=Spirillospora sp. NPDC048911 TaxID=3364527 RepID=UPI00371F6390
MGGRGAERGGGRWGARWRGWGGRSSGTPTRPAPPPALPADVGEAGQLTDILCDLAVDLREHRLYLPLADLDRFGVEPDDLYAGRWSPSVHARTERECF